MCIFWIIITGISCMFCAESSGSCSYKIWFRSDTKSYLLPNQQLKSEQIFLLLKSQLLYLARGARKVPNEVNIHLCQRCGITFKFGKAFSAPSPMMLQGRWRWCGGSRVGWSWWPTSSRPTCSSWSWASRRATPPRRSAPRGRWTPTSWPPWVGERRYWRRDRRITEEGFNAGDEEELNVPFRLPCLCRVRRIYVGLHTYI